MSETLLRLADESLVRRIGDLAKAHNRTLDSEAEAILRQAVPAKKTRAERVRRANEIAAMTPRDRVQTDSTILVREDRNR
jgi:antitoxin FitA